MTHEQQSLCKGSLITAVRFNNRNNATQLQLHSSLNIKMLITMDSIMVLVCLVAPATKVAAVSITTCVMAPLQVGGLCPFQIQMFTILTSQTGGFDFISGLSFNELIRPVLFFKAATMILCLSGRAAEVAIETIELSHSN